jgi:hypothetical protein
MELDYLERHPWWSQSTWRGPLHCLSLPGEAPRVELDYPVRSPLEKEFICTVESPSSVELGYLVRPFCKDVHHVQAQSMDVQYV